MLSSSGTTLQTLSDRQAVHLWSDWLSPSDGRLKVRFNGNDHAAYDGLLQMCKTPTSRADDGVTVEAYEYRRYDTASNGPFWTPLRFPGHYFDAETGFFENWHRYYDPNVGRYLEPEPMLSVAPSVASVYAYAEDNPLDFLDPDGWRVIVHSRDGLDKSPSVLPPTYLTSEADLRAAGILRQGEEPRTASTYPVIGPGVFVDNACKPYKDSCGHERWHFDVTVTTDLQTAYNWAMGFAPDSKFDNPSLNGGVKTLGEHEALHVKHFLDALANPTTGSGLEVGTEGFPTPEACKAARDRWERDGPGIYQRYLEKIRDRSAAMIDLYRRKP